MEIALTLKQIEDMKHAIGYNPDKVKKGKYEAYRNYYAAGDKIESWEELVKNGAATRRMNFTDAVYHVSNKGLNTLSVILGIIITESN